MSDKLELSPTSIKDEEVLKQCRDALNKWSSKLPFAITRKLGNDGEFLSASMYHAYTFKIATEFAHRQFVLEKGGTPVNNPTPIENVNMWNIGGAKLTGNYKVGLPSTCYAETCTHCHGDGRITCPDCNGSRHVKCSRCKGEGEEKCSKCGGKGEVRCPSCGGGGMIGDLKSLRFGSVNIGGASQSTATCSKCHSSGKVGCHKCHGKGSYTCSKCHGRGEGTCSKCKGWGGIKC